MSGSKTFTELVRRATDRQGVARMIAALGFDAAWNEVPQSAWGTYGAAQREATAVLVVGRSGTAEALLLEARGPIRDPGRDAARLARRVRGRTPARLFLVVVATPDYDSLVLGTFGVGDSFRHLVLEPGRPRASDLVALEEMRPVDGETGLRLILRHARALDRTRITGRFFRDFRARREAVAAAWRGVPADAERERAQLALLFLSRLTFLYFLQSRGALAGVDRYLPGLFGDWVRDEQAGRTGTTFYRARLMPLFFGALNRRPGDRDAAARALGDLPFLNGGLFERHGLERRFPGLDLPDPEARSCLDHLLERYRFTTREAGAGGGYGVDPEILGRVFEGLMSSDRRSETGSFYTPAPVVDRVVREAVAAYVTGRCPDVDGGPVASGEVRSLTPAQRYRVRRTLERVRVLDPACGSGAFLLGALQRLERALMAVSDPPYGPVRREIVAGSLHGVDLLDDAALLCSLRLWLALSAEPGPIRPLPNLDRRVRQGDALVDPLDLASGGPHGWHPLRDPRVRRAVRAVGPAGRRYLESGPDARERCRRRLQSAELELARSWIAGLHRARSFRLRELEARAVELDLFGEPSAAARSARHEAELVRVRVREIEGLATVLDEKGALPFFSFGIHFADASGGFDIVVSNPPWIRAHRWPHHIRRVARRFEVRRTAGWAAAGELTGTPAAAGAQVDLSLLFAERALGLLAPGGVLAILLPAKFMRALYGGSARRILVRDLEFTLIEDHALDQRSIFRADAFVSVIVGRRTAARPGVGTGGEPGRASAVRPARVRLLRRGVEPLEYTVAQRDLPLFPDDPASPWIMAPPEVVAVFRSMQTKGPPLGRHRALRVRRGVMTGANDVLVLAAVDPGLGGLSRIEAEGYVRARRQGRGGRRAGRFRAVIETAAIRPVVRGADIDAFRYEVGTHLIWAPGVGASAAGPAPRLERYLERHRPRLEGRSGWRSGMPLGALFRISAGTLEPKVAWHDLSDTIRAVALPPTARFDGAETALVPLNTVYFLPVPDPDDAFVLAGLLNSGPIRTMARAIAERAKDARFRFFAWTVSCLPLPRDWRGREETEVVRRISAAAHDAAGLDPPGQQALDRAVAGLYGLGPLELEVLGRFDRWLRGES